MRDDRMRDRKQDRRQRNGGEAPSPVVGDGDRGEKRSGAAGVRYSCRKISPVSTVSLAHSALRPRSCASERR